MPTRVASTTTPAARSVRYDVGPALLNATGRIDGGTDNPTIDRMTGDVTAALQRNGVKDTKWVGELLYQMRGARLGVPGDLAKFKANVDRASRLGVLGPRGRTQLLARVGAADNQARNDNSILNVRNQPQPQRRDLYETPALLKGTRYEYRPKSSVFERPAQRTSTPQKTQAPAAKIPTPKLDAAITGLDKALKVMPDGAVKQSLTTVKSALELARTAEQKGDPVARTKAIGTLSQDMFKTVGEVVKTFGKDEALAKQAAEQLGKIAGALGKGVKVLGAVDNLSKVLFGKSLGGTPANASARVDAAIDLTTTFLPGPVGTGVTVARAELLWCYEHIGVPAKQAMTDYGLKRLFNGKTPEQLKATLNALPVDDPKQAQRAAYEIVNNTFKNTTSGFSQATASELWKQHFNRELAGDQALMQEVFERRSVPAGADPFLDQKRTLLAEKYRRAALRFIDAQVADAKGSWGV